MSQGFLCYLCTIISLSYYSFIHLSKLLYTALNMALNMKEFLPTGRFLQESHFLKSFHGLPTQVLVLPIITKAFDWAESKCPGRPSWVINIPFSRQRISNSEMLPCPLLLQIHYLAISDFLLCVSLACSSEPQGLSQPTTKWQSSCQALISCALTPACDHSSLRKTWMECQMEIQGSSIIILPLVQLLTLMHQQELIGMFNLTSLTTLIFCL